MSHTHQPGKQDHDPVIEDLLQLPARNLEDRIHELRNSIRHRRKISDEILTDLGTSKRRARHRKKRLRYAELTNPANGRIRDVDQQLSALEKAVHEELLNCFSDLRLMQEKLDESLAELAMERTKLRLLDSQPRRSATTIPQTENGRNRRTTQKARTGSGG